MSTDIAAVGYEVDSSGLRQGETALDRFAGANQKAAGQVQNVDKRSAALAATMRTLMRTIAPIAGALAAAFGTRGVINAAEQYENRTQRINAILTATGGIAGRTAKQLEDQAQSLARATLESVDGVRNAQQVLLTFRNVQGDVFDRAIESAADLSAALGQDLVSSTRQLARALEDPIQGVTALTRSGTVFTHQQREQIRTLVESGRTLEAQNLILDELQGQYGGAREAASDYASAKDSLAQSVENLQRALNAAFSVSDRFTKAIQWLDKVVQTAEKNIDALKDAFRAMGVVVVAMASTQIPALVTALAAKTAGMTAATVAAGALTTAMRVLGAAVAIAGGPWGILAALIAGAASWFLIFRDNTSEAELAAEEAAEATRRLNEALGTFYQTAAPSAAKLAIELANANYELANSAFEAARAEVAKRKAIMEAATATMEQQMDPYGAFMEGEKAAQAVRAYRAALDGLSQTETRLEAAANKRRQAVTAVTGAMSEQMTATDAMNRNLNLTIDATDNLTKAMGGGAGASIDAPGTDTLIGLLNMFRETNPYEEAFRWYQEANQALIDAQLIERGLIEEHNAYRLEIEQLYQQQLAEIRRQEMDATLGHYQSFFSTMAGAFQSGGERMLKISKAFGVAEAIVSMWRGAAKALELPFPANMAAWAQVLATGMKAVQGIQSVRPGSSGRSPAQSSAASSTASQSQPDRIVRVSFDGPDWVKGMIEPIMTQIYEQTGDGTKVIFGR